MFSDTDHKICNYLGKLWGLRQYFLIPVAFFLPISLGLESWVCVCVCSSRVPKKSAEES